MASKKSLGLRNLLAGIDTELIASGGFSSAGDLTSWTAVASTPTSISGGYGTPANNCLQIASSGNALGTVRIDIATKAGHLYQFSCCFMRGTAASGKMYIGTVADYDSLWDSGALTDAAWTKYTKYFVATSTTTRITLETTDATTGETSLFDACSMVWMARSYKDIFNGGQISIYTGSMPTSPNDAPTGTLLAVIMNNGTTGITFRNAVDGAVGKATGEYWTTGVSGNAASGTAGWFRLTAPGDSGSSSQTDPRWDGTISISSGAEMTFDNTVFTVGGPTVITDLVITQDE